MANCFLMFFLTIDLQLCVILIISTAKKIKNSRVFNYYTINNEMEDTYL